VEISIQSPNTEIGAQNQYGRVILSIDWKFYMEQEKVTFGDQKGENKPSEPKNGIQSPKNQK
jgi:hypothetical protein